MFLIAPFGAMSGFVSVTVAWQLKAAGVSVGQVASIVALTLLPHTWKFLWAPITDTTLTQKRWYLISSLATGIGIVAIGLMPPTPAGLSALAIVVFTASVATTFMGMAVESLPKPWREEVESFRRRPSGRFIMRLYREERIPRQ